MYRDGADTQYMQYLQKPYNLTTNTLKAYLSTQPGQPSSLSAFIVSKSHRIDQKPRTRQLNAKCAVVKVPKTFFQDIFCV